MSEEPSTTEVEHVLNGSAPKSGDVRSVFDLVRYAYDRAGQRLATLKATTVKALGQSDDLTDAHHRAVELLSEADRDRLAVPVRLLHLWQEERLRGRALGQLLSLLRTVVEHHPLLQQEAIHLAIRTGDHEALKDAIAAIVSSSDEALAQTVRVEQLTPKDAEELRANATHTLTLLAAAHHNLTAREVAPLLFEALWEPATVAAGAREHPLVALTSDVRTDHLAVVVDVWAREIEKVKDHAAEQSQLRLGAQRRAQRLEETIAHRERQRDEALGRVSQLEDQLQELRRALQTEQQLRSEGQTHASYDYEQLRARSVKRMKKQSDLLSEGLHALRREPPIIHVGIDRMERTLERLTADLQDLGLARGDES